MKTNPHTRPNPGVLANVISSKTCRPEDGQEAYPDEPLPPKQEHISKLKASMAFEARSAPILAAARLGLKPLHSKLLECLCWHNRTPSHEAEDDLKRFFAMLIMEHPPMSSPFQPAEQEQ